MMKVIAQLLILFILTASACYERYFPPGANGLPLLVVDAFVNSIEGSAIIKLSLATPLSANDTVIPVSGAHVTLSDEYGKQILFTSDSNRNYSATGFDIYPDRKYKLSIVTSEDKTYESDWAQVNQTPPIDSVTWSVDNDRLNIKVNTHDVSSSGKYYQWRFDETWEYFVPLQSAWQVKGSEIVPRKQDESIQTCWQKLPGYNINIYSTDYLRNDIVSNFKIHSIDPNSFKLSYRYSINVKQQTLTEEAYKYLQGIKKTDESVGTLFDPLPSAVKGNIHCLTNPQEPVIGYFTVGNVSEKRIYINRTDLGLFVTFNYPRCEVDTANVELAFQMAKTHNILYPVYTTDGVLLGWAVTTPPCSDCRAYSDGETTKPSFWID